MTLHILASVRREKILKPANIIYCQVLVIYQISSIKKIDFYLVCFCNCVITARMQSIRSKEEVTPNPHGNAIKISLFVTIHSMMKNGLKIVVAEILRSLDRVNTSFQNFPGQVSCINLSFNLH